MRYNGKTETLFDRDLKTFKVIDKIRKPEFEMIDKWYVTQKLDGSSGIIYYEMFDGGVDVSIHGRTAKSKWNPEVEVALYNIAHRAGAGVVDAMVERNLQSMAFYGEVVGPKVQSGGRYRRDIGFYVFDIIVNDKIFLNPESITEAAQQAGFEEVPFLGVKTTDEILDMVRSGLYSVLKSNEDFIAEGVVAKSPFFDNMGRQIKWKLKHTDF